MTVSRLHDTVILAMGNDILGDDGIALYAARILREEFVDQIDVIETAEAGLAIMELLEGYSRALILDCVLTAANPVGTITEMDTSAFRKIVAPSPHYAGLPEVLELAGRLGISFPAEIRILAIEVHDPMTLREGLTPETQAFLPVYTDRARRLLAAWSEEQPCMNTP